MEAIKLIMINIYYLQVNTSSRGNVRANSTTLAQPTKINMDIEGSQPQTRQVDLSQDGSNQAVPT